MFPTIAVTVLITVLCVFAVKNWHVVAVDLVVVEKIEVKLTVLMLTFFAIGFIVASLIFFARWRRWRRMMVDPNREKTTARPSVVGAPAQSKPQASR